MRISCLDWAFWMVLVCASGASANGPEGSWSRFRGPEGRGVQAGPDFPAAWDEDDYLWEVELPGKGHSSPVIWQRTAFVTSGTGNGGEIALQAFRVDDGEELWQVRFDGQTYPMHNFNTLASCTPAVDGERVYLSLASPHGGDFVALDHAGHQIWRRSLGSFDSHHGSGISPIVHDDRVFLACDHEGESFVTALDAATGETVWQVIRRSGKASYATPTIWRGPQGEEQLIVNSTAEGMTALAPDDGEILWQLPELFPERCVNSPLLAEGFVLAGCGGGSNGVNLVCVRPTTRAGEPAEVVYQLQKSVPQVPTPVAQGKLLFVVHDRGAASCRDVATGEDYWAERLGSRFSASPICVGGKLYCVAEDGSVVVLAAEKEFRELGRGQLPGSSYATPAVAGNYLVFRTESGLHCLAAEAL